MRTLTSIAPGKLILSGEYAVGYGAPALVLAVDRHVQTTLSSSAVPGILFSFADLHQEEGLSAAELKRVKATVDDRYNRFLRDILTIREVLQGPITLIAYTAGSFLEHFTVSLEQGVQLRLRSDLPAGCGMGSSVAAIMSVLKGMAVFFSVDCPVAELYRLGHAAEKMQHGRPSGVDAHSALYGGFIRFQQGRTDALTMSDRPLWLVHTGTPETTTGECVMAVAARFKDSAIWNDFETVTQRLERAVTVDGTGDCIDPIRENHRLLKRIGVVPDNVAAFIEEIEQAGGAAKICGAGSIRGERGGMVWVYADAPPHDLCSTYGYSMMAVKGERYGARIV